ncbi:Inosine/uridine-preferring nucleoside hydrolase domain-containing protein [Limtongia smithiae]|uniref:Inosine/uridine-preferring nucleoside hydrolase domain-containing protein n=1 Tax=Limtongia smithiae TaxID=1125753 RepID=UPI0034CF1DF4
MADAAKRTLIIDCDPGVDDTLALLLALNTASARIPLISLCFGNVDVAVSIRNVVAIFKILETERAYRTDNGKLLLKHYHYKASTGGKDQWPLVALGSKLPVSARRTVGAEFFHGDDGLGGVHSHLPQFSPADVEIAPFFGEADGAIAPVGYIPSREPSWREILRVLREEPADTVTVVAIAPLSNIARAAMEDPVTFARAREVVCMGGNINVPGNMTPFAEFNFYADIDAAAIVFATTSRTPGSTLPPSASALMSSFNARKEIVKPMRLVLFPLDITVQHRLRLAWLKEHTAAWTGESDDVTSPLVRWMNVWLGSAFGNMAELVEFETHRSADAAAADLEDGVGGSFFPLHDPTAMYYALLSDEERASQFVLNEAVDVRIETVGQFTWGMCVVDRRGVAKRGPQDPPPPRDVGDWLLTETGNRIDVAVRGPGSKELSRRLLETIFHGHISS